MTTGNGPRSADANEVSPATLDLALDIQSTLLRELGDAGLLAGTGLDESLDDVQRRYPGMLLGALALQIVDAELPEGTTPTERAKATAGALRRILNTPELLEQILGAPYSPAWFGENPGLLSIEADPAEAADAAKLRQKVAQTGYLSRPMFTELGINRPTQLQYVTYERVTYGVRREQNALPEGSIISLKLVPATLSWGSVKQYSTKIIDQTGTRFEGFTGERSVTGEAFKVITVDPVGKIPPYVQDTLVNNHVRIGSVSTNSRLELEHTITMSLAELLTRKVSPEGETLRLPAKLQQAYLGNTLDYPLFAA